MGDRHSAAEHLPVLPPKARDATRAWIARLVDSLEPTATRLGCTDELAGVRALLAENGADRQRYVAEREGLVGLVSWLVRETESGVEARIRPSVAPAARTRPAPPA